MKIVVNRCFGGFSVSEAVYKEIGVEWDGFGYLENEDLGITSDHYMDYRAAKALIDAIEKIGEGEAGGSMSELRVKEIPDNVDWEISNYDGMESIEEVHRSW
jgi:hypothetical protein